MGNVIVVTGASGTGKSRSLMGFDENEIFLVNVQGKRPPFRKSFKYVYVPSAEKDGKAVDVAQCICNGLSGMGKAGIKTAVIDDAGYLMTQEFMAKHSKREGSKQFDLYNEIADSIWKILNHISRNLPEDVNVYLMFHEMQTDYGNIKIRTIGRLLDEKVCIEGTATVCIRCMTDGKRHWFATQNSGNDICKSPEGMLPLEMPNDLKMVDCCIRDYWGYDPIGKQVFPENWGTDQPQDEQETAEQPEEPGESEETEEVEEEIDFS